RSIRMLKSLLSRIATPRMPRHCMSPETSEKGARECFCLQIRLPGRNRAASSAMPERIIGSRGGMDETALYPTTLFVVAGRSLVKTARYVVPLCHSGSLGLGYFCAGE